jgi:two-component system, cell cycle sensor histidine kinase and response regulator CckA
MVRDELKSESLSFQWNFYERSVNNYSIIMRILNCLGNGDSLIKNVPRIFVEETPFEVCKLFKSEKEGTREGFFSLDNSSDDLSLESIRQLNGGALSPSMVHNVSGYGSLYVYPLKEETSIFGYVVLAKDVYISPDRALLRELEIVCDIYNKTLLLSSAIHDTGKEHSAEEPMYESVIDEFPDAMLLVDRNGSICFANKRAKEEFEGRKGFLLGERLENLILGIDEDFYRKATLCCGEVTYRSGETLKIFKMNCYPIGDKKQIRNMTSVILTDVAEEKFKNEENILREKMGSVGLLAGGIAHDFNNLLTGVLGYASLIKNFLPKEEKLYKYAEAIEHSAQRASKLTQHLLNFSRRQRRTSGVIDLNALLEDVLFLLKESFRDVEIEKSLHEALPPVKGDEAELQNVFLNLCINAKDAMNGVGTIKVRTARKKQTGDKEFALIEIEDSGKGIDESIKTKIFEPYFSTKENGKNLGMGLYIVSKVIREHGGFLELDSKPGQGTKFSLYIPLAIDNTWKAAEPEEEVTRDSLVKKRKILVVDDEDIIREFVKGLLTDAGVHVLEARDGKEAIQLFHEHCHSIDLVILDMIMPGIKGDEVLKEIRVIRPETKVIVSSGFMSEEQRDNLKEHRVDAYLDKPYRDKDVMRTILDILSK